MKKTTNSSPYQFEGRIPLSQAIPLGYYGHNGKHGN